MVKIGISDIVTIVSSVIAAGFACGTYFKGLRHDKRQDTLDAYNKLQEQALDKLCMIRVEEMKEISKNPRSERYKEISTYIARIEHFCVGVNTEIYDKKTVYQLAHGFLDGSIRMRIAPILEKKSFDGREYYENTKKVIAWMDKVTEKKEGQAK